jgi:hypothetical protein
LEYKQLTGNITWLRYRHICRLFFDVVVIHVEALITAVDERVKALVVLQTEPSLDLDVLLPFVVLLLHANARPHIARTTAHLLNAWHWQILPHPPFSPDLAPTDFHLLPKLKKHLRGLRFQTDEDVEEEVMRWLRLQDHQGFDSFICRYQKCLNMYGDYVEKQPAYVPISKSCLTTYRSLFIFQIKK